MSVSNPFGIRRVTLLSAIPAAVVYLLLIPALASAQQGVTKTVTWTFSAAPLATQTNTYEYMLKAFASQKGFAADTQYNPANQKPGTGTFAANAALPAVNQTVTATSGAATATGGLTISSSAPVAVGGLFQSTSIIDLTSTLVTPANGSTAVFSHGVVATQGGLATGAAVVVPGQKVAVAPNAQGKASSKTGLNTATGKWNDPISLGLFDSTTSTMVAQQQLGAINTSYDFNGSFQWNSVGLALTAPLDGQSASSLLADIGDTNGAGVYSGSWVTDSYKGLSSATLANGVFTTTGIFAGLPWVASPAVNPTSETLPAGYLQSLTMDYQIPTSLINGTDIYYEMLTNDGTFNAAEVAVPEPASLSLLMIAGVVAGRRSRK